VEPPEHLGAGHRQTASVHLIVDGPEHPVMDGEIPFTNLLRGNHHWPFCHAPTLTRLTLTSLTLIPVIMRILTILFPAPGRPVRARLAANLT
jgi:hypothetical protein